MVYGPMEAPLYGYSLGSLAYSHAPGSLTIGLVVVAVVVSEVFDQLDLDKSGSIDRSELREACEDRVPISNW